MEFGNPVPGYSLHQSHMTLGHCKAKHIFIVWVTGKIYEDLI